MAIRANAVGQLEERKKTFALTYKLLMTAGVWRETFPELRPAGCFCFREVVVTGGESGLEEFRV